MIKVCLFLILMSGYIFAGEGYNHVKYASDGYGNRLYAMSLTAKGNELEFILREYQRWKLETGKEADMVRIAKDKDYQRVIMR